MTENNNKEIPFHNLTPDVILEAVDNLGYLTSGRLLALNSYENRVYQVGIEDESPVVVKFYRPERWSKDSILEEHEFSIYLAENDVPVVPPINTQNKTLHEFNDYYYAVYERKPGRAPDITIDADLEQLGRLLARIHLLGRHFPFEYREKLSVDVRGVETKEFILQRAFLPEYLRSNYEAICSNLLDLIQNLQDRD